MPKKKATKQQKVSVLEYVEQHNPRQTRRGHKMSPSYIYRLIKQDILEKKKGIMSEGSKLWFDYVLEGEKEHIYILV
jgi:hypothetical protein